MTVVADLRTARVSRSRCVMKPKIGTLIAHYGVAVLLTVFVARQVYYTQSHDLTPWLGGGMGMFTTIDNNSNRVVESWLKTSDGLEHLIDDSGLRGAPDAVFRARIMPGKARLSELAQLYNTQSWTIDSARNVAVIATKGSDKIAHHVGVRSETWRVSFDPTTLRAYMSPLRRAESRDIGSATKSN
jgi:hypothetical protein